MLYGRTQYSTHHRMKINIHVYRRAGVFVGKIFLLLTITARAFMSTMKSFTSCGVCIRRYENVKHNINSPLALSSVYITLFFQEYEETIKSLRTQVSILTQRASLLQDEVDRSYTTPSPTTRHSSHSHTLTIHSPQKHTTLSVSRR